MPAKPTFPRPRSSRNQPTTLDRPNRRRAVTDRREATVERRQIGAEIPAALTRRVIVERIRPAIDNGRWPIKRTIGEPVHVFADIFADGHDVIAAVLRDRGPAPPAGAVDGWRETPMTLVAPGTDEWEATFVVSQLPGWHLYQVVAWVDPFLTWRRALQLKAQAGQDVALELLEGSLLVRDAIAQVERAARDEEWRWPGVDEDRDWLLRWADTIADSGRAATRIDLALAEELPARMARFSDRSRATRSATLRVWVDRERARFGSWYEMFPRSAGTDPNRSGTLREATLDLPRIADLNFDVVYLPPIHPIGRSFRKGRNNALAAGPDDPGSPWAIGSAEGGHTAIEPALGSIEDFIAFRTEAERLGLEVALDLAWQCSPDHPWVREHPEWFRHRPDGSIRYAENPPKKYQDIYPFDFESDDWRRLWEGLLEVTSFWVDRGVKIFRVDNPHTKTLGFWEWLIDRVHQAHPDVVFLSEAFTRPRLMRYLAKAGFTQSYTYFTWRNTKSELTEYFTELIQSESREYLRPNLFVNTPDILHAYLQDGGRPAFEARLLLAATLGASYGMYSGFELIENRAVAAGSEEYADSEKYQFRKRDWNSAGNINELVSRVNRVRRQQPALQLDWTLRFHATDNPAIIAYSKQSADGGDWLLTVVNLDPHHMQHGRVDAPFDRDTFTVHDLLDDERYGWRRGWNYVRFDPGVRQGHILKLDN